MRDPRTFTVSTHPRELPGPMVLTEPEDPGWWDNAGVGEAEAVARRRAAI